MHATTLFVLAAAGFAAAQSSAIAAATLTSPAASGPTALSGCGTAIDAIISDCLNTENTQLLACPSTDWDCMCTQITNVVTCYNNCPSDPNAFAATQRKTSYCNAAAQFGSKASTSTGAAVTSAASGGDIAAVATATTSSSSASNTASATSSTASPHLNSMAHLAAPAGGAIAAFLGLAALL